MVEKLNLSVLEEDRDYVLHPWRAQQDRLGIVVTGGEGVYFFDDAGTRYLDFYSGWTHLTLGYQHPRLVAAIIDQVKRIVNVNPDYVNEPAARLGHLLADVTPGDLVKSYFTTGGTDADETAIKIARAYTGRSKVISRYRSYHGNSYGAGTISGDPRRLLLEPALPNTVRALDQYCYRCPFGLAYPSCQVHCADHIGELIELEGPQNVAAVIAEPVVGSNGGMAPPPEYWPKLRQICDHYGVLLIADEVITGMGRTGKWFGVDHWGVTPDILVLAKGLTGGLMPLGATVIRRPIAEFLETRYLDAGLTYQSHPVSCATGVAAIQVLQDENLIQRAEQRGRYLEAGLRRLQAIHPTVGEVRGLGLYWTLELVRNRQTRERLVPWNAPAAECQATQEVSRRLLERHTKVSVRWNNMQIAPPLIVSEAEIDAGLEAIDYALQGADQWYTGS
ncbi:MAG: aminotransferase class III-fold pyridoxal phosphate-dependent enzyme [Chloroflexi bacterium]|nr:aminotransferase class III-fold pyridoxal phosphate-dependent enzyme [Chloroflexota bacterium]